MERLARNESLGEKESKRLDKKVYIKIHSRRKRLADPGGISDKATIDGLVIAGILVDDSAEFIEEISHSQEKCKASEEEETIISIYVEA